jgi:hypothetical protein
VFLSEGCPEGAGCVSVEGDHGGIEKIFQLIRCLDSKRKRGEPDFKRRYYLFKDLVIRV